MSDIKDKKPDVTLSPVHDGQPQQRRDRRHRNRSGNNNNNSNNPKERGKTPCLENDLFDNTGVHDAVMFHRLLQKIADYIQLNYMHEVSEAVQTMTPVTITIPPATEGTQDPSNPRKIIKASKIDVYLWKKQHEKASTKLDKYEVDMARAFVLIYHQCTTHIQNEINATNAFLSIRTAQDPITLLKLIQSLCFSYDAKTQSVMATVASHKKLFTYYQKDGFDNHKYYQEFCANVENLRDLRGDWHDWDYTALSLYQAIRACQRRHNFQCYFTNRR